MARKKQIEGLPTQIELMLPTLKSLMLLGGSGSIKKINSKVYEIAELSETTLQINHGSGSQSEVDYRLAWSRKRLKDKGLINNPLRGFWIILKPDVDINKLML